LYPEAPNVPKTLYPDRQKPRRPAVGGDTNALYCRAVIANASTKIKEYLLSGKLLFTFVL
jgi:hypothetical protein